MDLVPAERIDLEVSAQPKADSMSIRGSRVSQKLLANSIWLQGTCHKIFADSKITSTTATPPPTRGLMWSLNRAVGIFVQSFQLQDPPFWTLRQET